MLLSELGEPEAAAALDGALSRLLLHPGEHTAQQLSALRRALSGGEEEGH